MKQLGTMLIYAGIILLVCGIFFSMGGRISWLGRLPGDIRIVRPHMSLYFPITTSILMSIVISLVIYLMRRFR